jgi:hypothetical protein
MKGQSNPKSPQIVTGMDTPNAIEGKWKNQSHHEQKQTQGKKVTHKMLRRGRQTARNVVYRVKRSKCDFALFWNAGRGQKTQSFFRNFTTMTLF